MSGSASARKRKTGSGNGGSGGGVINGGGGGGGGGRQQFRDPRMNLDLELVRVIGMGAVRGGGVACSPGTGDVAYPAAGLEC
jgi:hypothetical protein